MKIKCQVSGVASANHAYAIHGDVIRRGAFGLTGNGTQVPLWFRHLFSLGTAEVRENPYGNIEVVTGHFVLDTSHPDHEWIFNLLQNRMLQGFSVRYSVNSCERQDHGTGRVVTAAKLKEISLCEGGADPFAKVTAQDWRPLTIDELLNESRTA